MSKKKSERTDSALTVRAFIKLLRKDKTLEDLDRLKVYNTERQPITSVKKVNGMMIISCEVA